MHIALMQGWAWAVIGYWRFSETPPQTFPSAWHPFAQTHCPLESKRGQNTKQMSQHSEKQKTHTHKKNKCSLFFD